jgi:selenide,water dikinase
MKRLLLLGGGHSHVEVIRRLAGERLPDAEVTLVSPGRYAPYSGMLPGLIAGHYAFHDCHIDLERLCDAAGITFRRTAATGFDAAAGSVSCADGSSAAFDVLSLDVGSVSDAKAIPGALEHATRVKPVEPFLQAWEEIRSQARAGRRPALAVVGAGAAGVELAAAMHHRLAGDGVAGAARMVLLSDTAAILPTHPPRARRVFERVLRERGIDVRVGAAVARIAPGRIHCADGSSLGADAVILATGASAPGWIAGSGVKTDARGFVAVHDTLQSASHPNVFAAGDIATLINAPRPKMGVYAVRQGPILFENLRRTLLGAPLLRYAPQRRALALLSTGGKHAVASWDGLAFEGDWVWRWKDRIDRRFMARYPRSEP